MSDAKKLYSLEFQLEALRMVDSGKAVGEVAKHFGIGLATLYQWHAKARAGGYAGFRLTREDTLQTHRKFTSEYKQAVVRRIQVEKEPLSQVAREIGVNHRIIQVWRKQYGDPTLDPVRKLDQAEAEMGVQSLRAEEIEANEIQAEAERRKQVQLRRALDRAERMTADPLIWLQKYTETKDSHWRAQGAQSPYRPFPHYPYFRPLMDSFIDDQHVFIGKSRNMMLSWLCVGFFTHAAMTTEGIDILFQSQKEDKAFELVDYAKTLYDHQWPELQEAFPLKKELKNMADGELHFKNGSRILGIPGGADQIRSYHPWGLFMDEAAFMPEAADSYNNAVSVCKKIIVLSSAGPGWFADTIRDTI
ncbi:MAG TPA: transposase [Candidatus Angelobacter sp.]